MANRTVKDAASVKGTNPQYLVEKIIRSRIYDSRYWKEECFALTAELVVDKAMQLKSLGGVYGGHIKATPFLCLVLKMLQIQPEKDIIVEFIKNENFKYVRALGAYYMRLTGTSLDCYKYLEPLLNDYRKLRIQNRQGQYELTYMDEYIDNLMRDERFCDVILPRIQKRQVHEEIGELEARISALDEDLDDLAFSSGDDEPEPAEPPPPGTSPPPQSNGPAGGRRRSRSREKDRHNRRRDGPERGDYHPGPQYPSGYLRHETHRDIREQARHAPVNEDRHHRGEKRHRRDDDGHERRDKRHHRDRERERRSDRYERSDRRRERDDRRGERRERPRDERRRDRGGGGADDRRPRGDERAGRHRGEDERREIEEANALRAKLGLPPLRP